MDSCGIFNIDDYIEKVKKEDKKEITKSTTATVDKQTKFDALCANIKKYFDIEWQSKKGDSSEVSDELYDIQKNAIIGYPKEVNYYKDKINEYLRQNGQINEWHPTWYDDLTTAIFHEVWGLAGVYSWINLPESSSAKIIGEKIFYLINGKLELQQQKISSDRLKQLRKALMLRTPEKRQNEDYTEVYMLNGTRITIYDTPLAKEPVIIFRKYIIKEYSFNEQARRGTIPEDSILMQEAMVTLGYNVGFVGPVRSGKSTYYQTWESYEDPSLEGIQIETDPEVALHHLKPNSPIMQLVASGDRLRTIIPSILRGDADYINMAEARDGLALHICVTIANKGTRRVKITFHTSDPTDFCFDAANEIVKEFGGDLFTTIIKVAKSFNYLYEFIQLQDKSKKRLKSIYEIRYDVKKLEVSLCKICSYNFENDNWTFKYDIGEDKKELGLQENPTAFKIFDRELKRLSEKYPMKEDNLIVPYYNFLLRK